MEVCGYNVTHKYSYIYLFCYKLKKRDFYIWSQDSYFLFDRDELDNLFTCIKNRSGFFLRTKRCPIYEFYDHDLDIPTNEVIYEDIEYCLVG